LIAGVNHRRDPGGQQTRPVRGFNKRLDAADLTSRIEGLNTFAHSDHLGLAQGGVECVNLSVDI
jgi:hypothetical protein